MYVDCLAALGCLAADHVPRCRQACDTGWVLRHSDGIELWCAKFPEYGMGLQQSRLLPVRAGCLGMKMCISHASHLYIDVQHIMRPQTLHVVEAPPSRPCCESIPLGLHQSRSLLVRVAN